MSNDTATTTTEPNAAPNDEFDPHPRELEAPPRTREEEIFALMFSNLSLRGIGLAFATGVVIGFITGNWMLNSVNIMTTGLPDGVLIVMLTLLGGVGLIGAEVAASLTAAYVKLWYGLRVEEPL